MFRWVDINVKLEENGPPVRNRSKRGDERPASEAPMAGILGLHRRTLVGLNEFLGRMYRFTFVKCRHALDRQTFVKTSKWFGLV